MIVSDIVLSLFGGFLFFGGRVFVCGWFRIKVGVEVIEYIFRFVKEESNIM